MATVYCYSGAAGSNNGTSWTNAYTSLVTAVTNASNGDTILVHYQHSEDYNGTGSWDLQGGTAAAPKYIISVDKDNSDVYTRGAYLTTTSNSTYRGELHGVGYGYGLDLEGAFQRLESDADWYLEDCKWIVLNTGYSFNCGLDDSALVLSNCQLKVASTPGSSGLTLGGGGYIKLRGCSIDSGGGAMANIIDDVKTKGATVVIEDCDFSNMASGGDIVGALPTALSDGTLDITIANVKLPTSGSPNSASFAEGRSRIEAYNVATDNTIYRTWVEDYYGKVIEDTSNYRSGSYDGTNNFSFKMTTSGNGSKFHEPLRFKLWEGYCSADPTLTVELIHAAVGSGTAGDLQDDEFWIEVAYPDGTTKSHGRRYSTRMAINGSAADLTNSTETWTETLTGEVKQKVAVNIGSAGDTGVAGGAGVHTVWVNLAAASALSVYVDPEVDVT